MRLQFIYSTLFLDNSALNLPHTPFILTVNPFMTCFPRFLLIHVSCFKFFFLIMSIPISVSSATNFRKSGDTLSRSVKIKGERCLYVLTVPYRGSPWFTGLGQNERELLQKEGQLLYRLTSPKSHGLNELFLLFSESCSLREKSLKVASTCRNVTCSLTV